MTETMLETVQGQPSPPPVATQTPPPSRTVLAGLRAAGGLLLFAISAPVKGSNYDRRGEEVKRKAIKTLHVPYHRKDKAPK